MKYANQQKTRVSFTDENGRSISGELSQLIARGYLDEVPANIAPWRTLDEWKQALRAEVTALRDQTADTPIEYKGQPMKTRQKELDVIDALLLAARDLDPPFSSPTPWYTKSDTDYISMSTEADYTEVRRVIADRLQKVFNAWGQTKLQINALATVEECEQFDVEAVFNGFLV